jgi:hypothetical protein
MSGSEAGGSRWVFWAGLALVAVAAVASAAFVFQHHAAHERGLWVSPTHDRNANYRYSLQVVTDLRTGDIPRLVSDFDKGSIVWPPLHGVLLALLLLVGNREPTLAVVPSLIGWVGAAVFGYLAGNRAVRAYGPLAGLVAAALVLGNPTARGYAADCMLESLGGCLTFAVLHAYLRWEQDRTGRSVAWLGLALTLLFFEKYNYWLLTVLACGGAHLVIHRWEWWGIVRRAFVSRPWKAWLLAQLRHPLSYATAMAGVLCAAVAVIGDFDMRMGGVAIPVRGLNTLVTITYALVLLRFTLWWWTGGRHIVRELVGPQRYSLAYWHMTPVLVWFLIPLRLPKFIWFLSPANSPVKDGGIVEAAQFYWQVFTTQYAVGEPFLWATLVLAAVGVAGLLVHRPFRPAGWVVIVYAVITTALTVKHPNHSPRYLFTAAAGWWLVAGVGGAWLASLAARGRQWAGWAVAVAVLAVVGWAVAPHIVRPDTPVPRGTGDGQVSLRDLGEPMLAATAGDERVAVFGSHATKFWVNWCWLEAGRRPAALQVDYREAGAYDPATEADRPALFARWCEVTRCDAVVFIDTDPGCPLAEETVSTESHTALRELLPKQSTFVLSETIPVPGRGTISVWRRRPPAAP